MSHEDCLFEKIIAGEISADIVHDDPWVLGFRDISPQAPEHFLFIPKTHISTLDDAKADDAMLLGRLMLAAAAHARRAGFAQHGYRVVMNCGEDGGQSVHHIHLHLLGGRALGWPPG